MSAEANALTQFHSEGIPRGVGTWLTIAAATIVLVLLPLGSYRVVILALVWSFYVVSHPRCGLWLSPSLIMVASFIAPPAGFEWGVGYSPELAYWAAALSVALAATVYGYLRQRGVQRACSSGMVKLPKALYGFGAASAIGAVVGLANAYSLPSVAKQFFGCLLFVTYFWLAVRLAPGVAGIRAVARTILKACVLFSSLYAGIYIWELPSLGFHKELTILSTYAGSAVVLLLPQLVQRNPFRRWRMFAVGAVLFSTPFLAEYKRAMAGIFICALMTIGLRSRSKPRRYVTLTLGLTLFTIILATPILDYVGRAVSSVPSLAGVLPANVQSDYSVYLRLTESAQLLASTNSPTLLGTGLGSTLSWYNPYTHTVWTQETVDVGWVYLVVKLGLLGLGTFLWLLAGLCAESLERAPHGIVLGFLLMLIFFAVEMMADTAFVYFMIAPWTGMACGWLHSLSQSRRRTPPVPGRVMATRRPGLRGGGQAAADSRLAG
jgi:hypothetical protein